MLRSLFYFSNFADSQYSGIVVWCNPIEVMPSKNVIPNLCSVPLPRQKLIFKLISPVSHWSHFCGCCKILVESIPGSV